MMKVMTVFGTRPEAIKLAPVILELKRRKGVETIVCVTAQHREMLDDVLRIFGIKPDHDLNVMRSEQTLSGLTSAVLEGLSPLLVSTKPDWVLVHGDTTTTFAASVAAFYAGAAIGHVEAGLRTGNLQAPWPEEFNRRCVDVVADLLWAPTEGAAQALRREGAAENRIVVSGNTVIDALHIVTGRIAREAELRYRLWRDLPRLDPARHLVLVTGHRRESFGDGMDSVCEALNQLAARPDVEIVWPVHPNPQVMAAIERVVRHRPNFHIVAPCDYLSFVALMMRAHLIITDSGGIQEEAPSLSKPVLVTRSETERPEAIAAGTAMLVGLSTQRIVEEASRLLDNMEAYAKMTATQNPFGDGLAAERIVDSLLAGRRRI
jgi:UDP-N-acetylglucosamine 2-epimerase (non-hydrolysing)